MVEFQPFCSIFDSIYPKVVGSNPTDSSVRLFLPHKSFFDLYPNLGKFWSLSTLLFRSCNFDTVQWSKKFVSFFHTPNRKTKPAKFKSHSCLSFCAEADRTTQHRWRKYQKRFQVFCVTVNHSEQVNTWFLGSDTNIVRWYLACSLTFTFLISLKVNAPMID